MMLPRTLCAAECRAWPGSMRRSISDLSRLHRVRKVWPDRRKARRIANDEAVVRRRHKGQIVLQHLRVGIQDGNCAIEK